ncbi:DUF1707 and DUF4190 domain-containing protein [Actinoplanes sp. NPDC020271]|uniref:DUF1707 and DUF4190 domain-containing protein n=1 Tax=Actinoplanes sp. NPDC020271 TaxID=3363896 RepID=UPI0037AE2167
MYSSPHVRVSDSDREAIVAQLSNATAEGRLTIEEFSERSRAAYASRTWGELSAVLHDLPVLVAAPAVFGQPLPPARESKLPMLSLMFGFLPLPLLMCGGVGLLAPLSGIAAIVLGVRALQGPAYTVRNGRAMAVGGLALGTLSVLGMATFVALLLNGFVPFF